MESAASGKTCRNNKHLKKIPRINSLCLGSNCDYDATNCQKHVQENTNHQYYQQALRWKQDKVEELADSLAQTTLITDITEMEGRAACTETFQQMNESQISLHCTLDNLFIRDPNDEQK